MMPSFRYVAMSEWVPLPKQHIAMTCPARKVFFAGAAGPGKSDFMINVSRLRAELVPESQHVYFRRISKDLDAHLPKARKYIPSGRGTPDAIATESGDKTVRRFRFKNKAEFAFTHLQREDHVAGHEGAEYDTINWDEAGRFTPHQLNFVGSRLRTTNLETHRIGGPKEYLSANPQGVSFYYLRKNFVHPDPNYVQNVIAYYPIEEAMEVWEEAKEGLQVDYLHPDEIKEACKRWIKLVRERDITWRKYDEITKKTKKDVEPFDVWTAVPNEIMLRHGIEETHTRCFIPAFLSDNPYLGPDYVIQLAEREGDIAERLLEGDWSVFEGQFFTSWEEQRYDPETQEMVDWHVIPPITRQDWWPHMAGMDFGFSKESMTVIGFYCYIPDRDEWIRYDEIAVNQKTDPEIIRMFKSVAAGAQIDVVACDRAMFGTRNYESGQSQGDYYKQNGVPLHPVDKNRVQGWQVLRTMLDVNPRTGRPKLRVTSNCTYAINTIPSLVFDEKKIDDLDTEGEDHAADEMRYFAMMAANRESGSYWPDEEPVGVGSYDASRTRTRRAVELPSFLIGDEADPYLDWDIE